jgi:uncharacterized membrane protein YkgB
MNRIEGFVAWLGRVFEEDKSSDRAFGIVGGVFAFLLLIHTYSFLVALAGGLVVFVATVTVLRLAVSSPRFTVVIIALVAVAMVVIRSGLHDFLLK